MLSKPISNSGESPVQCGYWPLVYNMMSITQELLSDSDPIVPYFVEDSNVCLLPMLACKRLVHNVPVGATTSARQLHPTADKIYVPTRV